MTLQDSRGEIGHENDETDNTALTFRLGVRSILFQTAEQHPNDRVPVNQSCDLGETVVARTSLVIPALVAIDDLSPSMPSRRSRVSGLILGRREICFYDFAKFRKHG